MSAARSLLGSLIDYAGLFPPAQFGMRDAVGNYAAYLAGPHRAMLGRFVVSLARLDEFDAALVSLPAAPQADWQLSILAGQNPTADAATIAAYHARQTRARIVSIETKAGTTADIARLAAAFPPNLEMWFELPPASPDLPLLLEAVRATGRGAKIRTGGVTAAAFPEPAEIARFLRECHRHGVTMKATAGLHHPLRGEYRLTYDAGSPRARMFGFLNVLLAAALIHSGGPDADAVALLDDSDPTHFAANPDALSWRNYRFNAAQLEASRRALCRSFGSCSFTEPIEGLQELRWI